MKHNFNIKETKSLQFCHIFIQSANSVNECNSTSTSNQHVLTLLTHAVTLLSDITTCGTCLSFGSFLPSNSGIFARPLQRRLNDPQRGCLMLIIFLCLGPASSQQEPAPASSQQTQNFLSHFYSSGQIRHPFASRSPGK